MPNSHIKRNKNTRSKYSKYSKRSKRFKKVKRTRRVTINRKKNKKNKNKKNKKRRMSGGTSTQSLVRVFRTWLDWRRLNLGDSGQVSQPDPKIKKIIESLDSAISGEMTVSYRDPLLDAEEIYEERISECTLNTQPHGANFSIRIEFIPRGYPDPDKSDNYLEVIYSPGLVSQPVVSTEEIKFKLALHCKPLPPFDPELVSIVVRREILRLDNTGSVVMS